MNNPVKTIVATSLTHSFDDGLTVVDPNASSMVEALRDIGYSLESAVADVIDNSISASATRIDIRFGWECESSPWLAIFDDGLGMTESELVEAMRPGGKDPLALRSVDDLGRFGLGLKTASFSQCRKVTVVSFSDGVLSSRQWDLDLVRAKNKWVLKTPSPAELKVLPGLSMLGAKGTMVLWQTLDRLDLGSDSGRVHQVMNERVASICEHVSLVFHRFISGEPRYPKIVIAVNNNPIEAFDPFNAKHPATMHLGEEPLDIENDTVTFRPYILPHHSRVSAEEYERLGGREGYLRGQGFYIYRNRRLIIHGTWFRMARQDEMTKLARVQVDIPNTLDHLWTIDVRKSRAKPPEAVKKRLRSILERIRDTAKRPYNHRGTASINLPGEPVWQRLYHNEHVSYQPNNNHPILGEFRSDLPAEMRMKFDGILSVIGKSIPFAAIFNDMASRPKETDSNTDTADALEKLANLLFEDMATQNPEYVSKMMGSIEPFASNPDFISAYIKRQSV
jgi:hypothetical protein